jgi:hypothetical protein
MGALALFLTFLIPDLNSGSVSASFLRASKSLTYVVAFVLIVSLILIIKKVAPISKWSLYLMTLISLITISLGSFVAKSITELPKNYRNFESEGDLFIESSDLRSLSIWFNENTTSSEIYASNCFCEGAACRSVDYSRKALVAALIERRTLVQSPWLAASYSEDGHQNSSNDFNNRILTSVNFATAPTSADFTMLKNWSVGWYVVDLEVTPANYWTNSKAKVYENNSYLVIDLHIVKLN